MESLSYAQLAARVDDFCRLFLEHDLQPGQHFAVFSTNNADYVALYFACAYVGLVIVPLNAHLKEDEIQWILEDSAPAGVAVEVAYLDRVSRALRASGLQKTLRFVQGAAYGDWIALTKRPTKGLTDEQIHAKVDASTKFDGTAKADDLAIQMYTSGTTGRPKGVMLSHANITSLVNAWSQEIPLLPGESRFMQATPLFHVGGLLVCLAAIAAGAELILLPKFEPELACATLLQKNVTETLLVPAMIQRLLALPLIDQLAFPHLNTMVYGASLMPIGVLRRAYEVFDCQFLQGYGLTETSGVALCLRPEDHNFAATGNAAMRLTAAGRPVSCCEVRVADCHNDSVAIGTVGEIIVRGSNVMLGYWNNPEATMAAIVDGWLKTGDLGRMDSNGYIYIVGRSKDMINYSGENVYPAEVESVLAEHPEVAEVAVIGLPHDATGEEVVAVVVLNAPQENVASVSALMTDSIAEELTIYCHKRLANFKCPTRYIFSDVLPRTPAGKVQKQVLIERHS